MAHAEHFLTRLDRLAGAEIELALGLYRDPELLRSIVAAVTLPVGAERLAITRDEPDSGPFLVVTRHMLRRLFEVPDAPSREDFRAVAAWEPLLGPSLMTTDVAIGAELVEMGPIMRNARPRGARGDDRLRDSWNRLRSAGHMALLGSMSREREADDALARDVEGSQAAFSDPLVGTGVVTLMLKGARAAARMGKRLVPAYKQALAADVAFFELVDTILALLALGTRTTGLRAEIQKALAAAPGSATTPEAQRLRASMEAEIEVICEAASSLLDPSPDAPPVAALRRPHARAAPADHDAARRRHRGGAAGAVPPAAGRPEGAAHALVPGRHVGPAGADGHRRPRAAKDGRPEGRHRLERPLFLRQRVEVETLLRAGPAARMTATRDAGR